MPTTTHDPEVRCIANEAVRRTKGFSGWNAYEAAKGYVRRKYPGLRKDKYDAIIDLIKDRLEI
jgi:hypothetical protein